MGNLGFVGSGIVSVFPDGMLEGKLKFAPDCDVVGAPKFGRCVDGTGRLPARLPGGKFVVGSVLVFILAPGVGIAPGMGKIVLTDPGGGVGNPAAIGGKVSSGVGRSPGVATTVGNGVCSASLVVLAAVC